MHPWPVVHKVRISRSIGICIHLIVWNRRATLLCIDVAKLLHYSESYINEWETRRGPVLGFPIYVGWSVGAENEKSLCVRFDADAFSMDFSYASACLRCVLKRCFGNLWFLDCAFAGAIPSPLKLGKGHF